MKQTKLLIRVRKEKLCLFLSAIIPIIVRSIPEAIFPYPIGFDTPLYFVMGKEWIKRPLPFPLFVSLLGVLYFIGVDLVLAMKFIPTLVYGLLGIASFMFAKNYLAWGAFDSLLASLSLSLSIAMLRMSWDMHKLTLGIALMLLSYSFSRTRENLKGRILFFILSMLAIISHELITVTYLLTLVFLAMRRNENRFLALTVLVMGALCFFGAWYGNRLEKTFEWIPVMFKSAPFSSITYELHTNGVLILKLYLLTLPASIIGLFRDDAVTIWLAFNLLGSTATIISPSFLLGGVLPWRYILLLTVPLSVYAARGAIILGEKIGFGRKDLWALIIIFLVNFPSFSFLTTGALTTYRCKGIMPEHMAQSSIPLHDIEPTISLSRRVKEGVLLVHGDFIGWAKYYASVKVIGFGGTYGVAPTLDQALNLAKNESKIYLLFWYDEAVEKFGFKVLAMEGNLKLYEYTRLEEK